VNVAVRKIEKLLDIPTPRIRWHETINDRGFSWNATYRQKFHIDMCMELQAPAVKFIWVVRYLDDNERPLAYSGEVPTLQEAYDGVLKAMRRHL